jgi:hypothetical protein
MTDADAMLAIIYDAIDELNLSLDGEAKIDKAPDAVLFDGRGGGKLDSAGLVNLIVVVEYGIEDGFGVALTLADERAVSETKSPFRSVRSLAAFAAQRIAEAKRDG